MTGHSTSVDASLPSARRGERSLNQTALVLCIFLSASAFCLANSYFFFGTARFWDAPLDKQVHLYINVGCLVAVCWTAFHARGTLEYKTGQALIGALIAFGGYALLILATRLFFSRAMLSIAFCFTLFASLFIVWARHKVMGNRICVIGPLVSDSQFALNLGQVVHDPSEDLRRFDIVLVSLTGSISGEWSKALSSALLGGCKVRHVGEYIEELRGAISLAHFEVEHLPPQGLASYAKLKRVLDFTLVVFILPVALPTLLLGMLGVLLTSGWPVFFVQERIGRGEKPFRMIKLRTMRPETPGERLRAAIPGDTRVTPVGRLLRRFRIDELPQIWNVLRGDMSLIGPRPEAVQLHQHYACVLPKYGYRYLVRPGITGWAQVNTAPSANADEARQKLVYDLFYVKKLSLFLDLQIACRTLWTITHGAGVR